MLFCLVSAISKYAFCYLRVCVPSTTASRQFTVDPPKWFAHEVSLHFRKMLGTVPKGGPNDTVTKLPYSFEIASIAFPFVTLRYT